MGMNLLTSPPTSRHCRPETWAHCIARRLNAGSICRMKASAVIYKVLYRFVLDRIFARGLEAAMIEELLATNYCLNGC